VVTENGQGLGGYCPGRNMEHRRSQLAGDLEHVGDHQEQALAGGKRRGNAACLQGAMDRAGGAGLGLHLGHQGHGTPYVLFAPGALDVGDFPHV